MPKPTSEETWGHLKPWQLQKSTSGIFSISNTIDIQHFIP
jgi:hypothetical protein